MFFSEENTDVDINNNVETIINPIPLKLKNIKMKDIKYIDFFNY